MANMYRIYTQGDDYVGWHTAIYYHEEFATKYFTSIRKKYPNAYVVTEVLDDDTGKVISRKCFGKPYGVTIEEIKTCRQEGVSVIKYDIASKATTIVAENVLPETANKIILSGIGQDGYGTEWIYTVQPCSFCNHVYVEDILKDY